MLLLLLFLLCLPLLFALLKLGCLGQDIRQRRQRVRTDQQIKLIARPLRRQMGRAGRLSPRVRTAETALPSMVAVAVIAIVAVVANGIVQSSNPRSVRSAEVWVTVAENPRRQGDRRHGLRSEGVGGLAEVADAAVQLRLLLLLL